MKDTEFKIAEKGNKDLDNLWKQLKKSIESNSITGTIDILTSIKSVSGGGSAGGGSFDSGDWLTHESEHKVGAGSTHRQQFMQWAKDAGMTYAKASTLWGDEDSWKSAGWIGYGYDANKNETGYYQKPGNTTGKKLGGPVSANTPYIVGEAGPEMFLPDQNGTILPNGMMGGTCNITVELDGETIARKIAAPLVGEIRVRTGVKF